MHSLKIIIKLLLLAFCIYSPAFGLEVGDVIETEGKGFKTSEGSIYYRLEDRKVQIFFLDKEQKIITPLFKEGTIQVRFIAPRSKADVPFTIPLTSINNTYLEALRPLRLPLNYNLIIRLKNPQDPMHTQELPSIKITPEF